jgi:uncharacterized protein
MEAGNGRPLALVTGASSGIGLELAKVLAANGHDLVINAEDDELAAAEREIASASTEDIWIKSIQADLARADEVERLYRDVVAIDRPLDVLALNAGIGAGGDFVRDTDLEKELRLIDLNVRSTVQLAKLALRDMVDRDAGRVLFTSSIASTMPGAFQAVYNASKSFVQSFALAIRNELADTSITITSLMPGPTDTEFFERADMEDTKVGANEKDDPAEVARQGFEALMAGKEKVVAGSFKNKAQVAAGRFMPDSAKASMHRSMAEPGSGEE